jgi:N-acetyl-anhydromuramyl-L-alanine amidase AmpD
MPILQSNLKFTETLKKRTETNYIIIHHTEVKGRHDVKEVHQWHLNKGWAGIGYHYYIDKDGQIFEGRHRDTLGAHVKSHNGDSIGVCFEGHFDKEKMNEKQLEAAVLLISVLSLAYGNAAIRGHRNFNSKKSCPGANLPMKELVDRIKIQKKRFIRLHGDPEKVDYGFLLKMLD